MAALLAVGTTAASSADFTLTGEATSLFLTGTSGIESGSSVTIEVKSAAGAYYGIGALNPAQMILVLNAPGTYRVTRSAGASCGVDRA